ncbi:MAG: hypothetical protein CML40_08460 [Rhodobacteraceae bacterium]|nr:MAG: hypothetical protein CML40_08460 [Paracoccaceae bacterium]
MKLTIFPQRFLLIAGAQILDNRYDEVEFTQSCSSYSGNENSSNGLLIIMAVLVKISKPPISSEHLKTISSVEFKSYCKKLMFFFTKF